MNALARGLIGAGIARGPRRGLVAELRGVDDRPVRHREGRRDPGQRQPAYRTHELSYAVNQSGLRLLISAESFKTSDYRAMVEELGPVSTADDGGSLERVVYIGTDDWAALVAEGEGPSGDAVAARMSTLEPGDPINIQYTSGTTGYPKGATLSHRNILNNGFFVTELINFTHEDRLCIPVPFYHCFGMVMGNLGCTTHGATMVIPAPGFDPALTLRAVAAERCTACTACRRCSSRCRTTRASPTSTCPRCAPA